jgi:Ca-activated chloride channel family protein
MEQLANQGDGFYSYVDTFEEAERLFVEELTPTLTVVAADGKAQVTFDEEQVARYRLIGYQNRALDSEDFTDDSVDAGELGAGHQVSALYEVVPVTEADAGTPLGRVSLRWRSPDSGVNEQVDADIVWPEAAAEPTDSLRMAGLVAGTAELLKGNQVVTGRGVALDDLEAEAEELAAGDVAGAAELLDVIRSAQAAPPPPDRHTSED